MEMAGDSFFEEKLHFTQEIGGREGIRTLGLLVANEALSQLSYSPTTRWDKKLYLKGLRSI